MFQALVLTSGLLRDYDNSLHKSPNSYQTSPMPDLSLSIPKPYETPNPQFQTLFETSPPSRRFRYRRGQFSGRPGSGTVWFPGSGFRAGFKGFRASGVYLSGLKLLLYLCWL